MLDANQHVKVTVKGKPTLFKHSSNSLTIQQVGAKSLTAVPLRQLLAASFDSKTRIFSVDYLIRSKNGRLRLANASGTVSDDETASVIPAFITSVLDSAYRGVKQRRHLKVIVNPRGGVGKSIEVFSKAVEPVLLAAGCKLDVIYTTHGQHAYEITTALPLVYDAILSLSGDGLIHEILNGLAHHTEDPAKAIAIPIVPVPTGSANSASLNLLGLKDGFDVRMAALNAVKGTPMKVDVFSVLQNGKRSFSFLSQAVGLMADLDLGTEHLRWMGDTRFFYGMLRGIVQFKNCPVQLSYKAGEVNKMKMLERYQSSRGITPVPEARNEALGIPPLQHFADDTEGWTTFDKPVLYVYAGKGPLVSRDLMAWPVSLPNDGFIDIVAQIRATRSDLVKEIGAAHTGAVFWNPNYHYIKARAYRIKPLAEKGYLSVDGEAFPFTEFQVEVHPGLATFLSLYGQYAPEFKAPPPKST